MKQGIRLAFDLDTSDDDKPELPARLRDPQLARSLSHERVRLTVDFGTFQTAVAHQWGEGVRMARLEPPRPGVHPHLMSSRVTWIRMREGEFVLMGSTAERLYKEARRALGPRLEAQTKTRRSLKRFLFELEALPAAQSSQHRQASERDLLELFQEVLLLCLAPRMSGTHALLETLLSKSDVSEINQRITHHLRWMAESAGIEEIHPRLQSGIRLSLCLCVPNSLPDDLEQTLRQQAKNATRKVLDKCGSTSPVDVVCIREAEAVAFSEEAQGGESDKLCLDLGGGTADSALIAQGKGKPVLRAPAGVPYGGDDLDVLTLCLGALKEAKDAGQDGDDALAALANLDDEPRDQLLDLARSAKEEWAESWNEAEIGDPYEGCYKDCCKRALLDAVCGSEEELRLARTFAELDEPFHDCPPVEEGQVDTLQATALDPSNRKAISRPLLRKGVVNYLYWTVRMTVEPLLELARDRKLRIDKALLSGQGSLAPGVRWVVEEMLAGSPGARVELVADPAREREKLKLICVLGASDAHRRALLDGKLSSDVVTGKDVVLRFHQSDVRHRDRRLVRCGYRADGTLDVALEVGKQVTQSLGLFEVSCKPEIDGELPRWARFNFAELPRGPDDERVKRILLRFRPGETVGKAWLELSDGSLTRHQWLPIGNMGSTKNPIHFLPLEWSLR